MKYVVQGMPSRAPMIEYLARHVPGLEVCYDEGQGLWPTFQRSLGYFGDEAHIHFEDDVTLTVDFIEKAAEQIGSGRAPVQFFSRVDDPSWPARRPGISFIYTCAFYVPPRFGPAIAAWMPWWGASMHQGGHTRGHIDTCIADWMRNQKLGYWQVRPSLVQHTPVRSTINGHGGVRMSSTFRDPELRGHPYPELLKEVHVH